MTYEAVRAIFRSKPSPRMGVVAHLVFHPPQIDNSVPPEITPSFWTVRLYRDNFDSFSVEDRIVIHNWVSDIISSVREIEPRCYMEVDERVPKDEQ